jgi:hypothetical protein
MWHVARREMHAGCWWGKLKDRVCMEDLGTAVKIISKWMLNK